MHYDWVSNSFVFCKVHVLLSDEANVSDRKKSVLSKPHFDRYKVLNLSAPNLDADDLVNLSVSSSSVLLSIRSSIYNNFHASNNVVSVSNTTIGMHANSGFALNFLGMMTSRSDLTLTTPVLLTTMQRPLVNAIKI